MSNIIKFPDPQTKSWTEIEGIVDQELLKAKAEHRDALKKEMLTTLKTYSQSEDLFPLSLDLELPENITEDQLQAIQDEFDMERKRKNSLIFKITKLKASLLVCQMENPSN